MYSTFKLTGRKNVDSEVAIPEMYTPFHQPSDTNQIPFQEFIDAEVNNEKWDVSMSDSVIEKFSDIYTVLLPPSLDGFEWRSIEEIFPNTTFKVNQADPNNYPDLTTRNPHLFHSEFIRSFISSIETLYYLSNVQTFPVEHTSSNFTPSFEKGKWRPWQHIYSNCKSGRTYPHIPSHNKFGKYIVRLYWLGSWKKIYISDKLPVDSNNHLLLPCVFEMEEISAIKLTKTDSYRRTIEIWPFLLAKALMILASLTWTKENELLDFDIIQCLTGWISHRTDATNIDPLEVWQTCVDHTVQYTWSNQDDIPDRRSTALLISKSKHSEMRHSGSKKNLKSGSRPGSMKKTYLQLTPKEEPISKNRFVVIVGIQLKNLQKEDEQPWRHGFLVTQTRTVPILKPSTDEEFEAWKRYRWIDWAIEHNLINPRSPPNPIRSFKTVDPFRNQYKYLLPTDDAHSQIVMQERETSIHSGLVRKKGKNKPSTVKEKDITDWLDLEYINDLLKYVTIYYMCSNYKSKSRISNVCSDNLAKEQKYPFVKSLVELKFVNWKEIVSPVSPEEHRNEPIYIFSDCLFKQSIVINLTQTGYLQTVTERQLETESIASESSSECGWCAQTFLDRVKRNCSKSMKDKIQEHRKTITKAISNVNHDFPKASIIVTKFKWDNNRTDDIISSLTTFGSGCIVLNLKPGRHIFALWIKTECPYSVQVITNSYLCVGTLEETLTLMSTDSLLFSETYWNLVENLQLLIYSFGTNRYIQDLKEFYISFKPKCEMTKTEWLEIQEVFFKEFFDAVSESLGYETLKAMKILFKMWQFRSSNRCDFNDLSQLCYQLEEEEDMVYVKIMQKSAIKIQSFFRGTYERTLLNHHDPTTKNYHKTLSILESAGESFTQNERKLGAILLRKFIQNTSIPNLRQKYSWTETLANDICTSVIVVNTKLTKPGWTFIERSIFYVRTNNSLKIRINIFCNLSQYYIRVYNNDTSAEMKALVNNVAVNDYPPNNYGYTAVAYGWADDQPIMNCKIIFCCHEQDDIEDLVTFSTSSPKRNIISDLYVPNEDNILFKYVLDLKSESTIMTLHLYTDYPKAKIKLNIFNTTNPENKLVDIEGIGYVTIPILVLNNKNSERIRHVPSRKSIILKSCSSKNTRAKRTSRVLESTPLMDPPSVVESDYFVIEAFIEKNSWPLTATEWSNVEKERDKLLLDSKRMPVIPMFETPRWTMEVFCNNTDNVSFNKVTEKDDLLKSVKFSWCNIDPERHIRAKELRDQFIEENLVINENLCTDPYTRSLDNQIFLNKIMPPLDVTNFYSKPKEEVVWRTLQSEADKWKAQYETLISHADGLIEIDFVDKLKKKILTEENRKLSKINNWFDGVRKESEKIMEEAYEKRQKYIKYIENNLLASKKK